MSCMMCGAKEHLFACTRHRLTHIACLTHIQIMRTSGQYCWGEWVPWKPLPPSVEQKEEQEEVKAVNPEQARKEGKNVAKMLGRMLSKAPEQDYEVVADFATWFAEDVLGYTVISLGNAWSKGFISEWMDAKTKEDLDPNKPVTIGDMQQMLKALLPAPQSQPE